MSSSLDRLRSTPCHWLLGIALALTLSACGGDSGVSDDLPPTGDADRDGLTNEREARLGTNPNNADSDGDRVWDGDELNVFGTDPTVADSDGDGINDGADPQPTVFNVNPTDPASGLSVEYGVFTDNAEGSARLRITTTRYEDNHVVYAPSTAPGAPFLIYQTYIDDVNSDTLFNEGDLAGSVIAIMNVDGSRPRFLTDVDTATGLVRSNRAIDATPEPSPDGMHIIFVSDRDDPGSFQLRLYVMNMDGSNPVAVGYESNAPASGELDADPFWGLGNRITFKRQRFAEGGPEFSRVFTATIDPTTMTLSDVVERTAGANISLATPNGPGDFDPKISPDGSMIASYRHLSDTVPLFGDYDIWVGQYTDAAQPATSSITLLDQDDMAAALFARWNNTGDKLAAWQLDGRALSAGMDALDIVVYDLNIQQSPFSVTAKKTNITLSKDGWLETMPSWNTDPTKPDELIYSASRQF